MITNLLNTFSEAHTRYLRAYIDPTFEPEVLKPLQHALHAFEENEENLYSRDLSLAAQHFFLRFRSVSLLVEGLYWIGSYGDAGKELERYVGIEPVLRTATDKDLKDLFLELSQLPQMSKAKRLLQTLATSDRSCLKEKKLIIRELIRVGVNMAVIFHYDHHRYEEALTLLDCCRTLAERNSSGSSTPYGLLGQIDYFAACSLRNINRLNDCDKRLTQVLDHYLHRIDLKFDKYIDGQDDDKSWENFYRSAGLSRYRTAVTLMARSDLNRRRGKLGIALYENLAVARIILAKASFRLSFLLGTSRRIISLTSRIMY